MQKLNFLLPYYLNKNELLVFLTNTESPQKIRHFPEQFPYFSECHFTINAPSIPTILTTNNDSFQPYSFVQISP